MRKQVGIQITEVNVVILCKALEIQAFRKTGRAELLQSSTSRTPLLYTIYMTSPSPKSISRPDPAICSW